MRLFQNSGIYPSYRSRLDQMARSASTFQQRCQVFLDDRCGACHFLKPVLAGESSAFFTNADDAPLQEMWAREHGLPPNSSAEAILLSQLEEHRTEVFYNLDPIRFQSEFITRLPGCVRRSIAWRAAPSPSADLSAYSAVVCNFPAILQEYRTMGWRTAYFSPAHDPEMDGYAKNQIRPIDVLFVGGYSRHHRRRSQVLEAVARLGVKHMVHMHLDQSRLNRLSEGAGWMLPLWWHRRPRAIRALSKDPVFGRDLYHVISQAKIVLNGAVDMAGDERGNMRCFEAMGCGAAMVSDSGIYPRDMESQRTMNLYRSAEQAVEVIEDLLGNMKRCRMVASLGHDMIRTRYSKDRQWAEFCALV